MRDLEFNCVFDCGFYDSDYGCCTCPSYEMWYACPIESKKPENQKELEDYAKWAMDKRFNEDGGNLNEKIKNV